MANNTQKYSWQTTPAQTEQFYRTDVANNDAQTFDASYDPSRELTMDELRAKVAAMPYNNPNFWSTKR